MCRWVKVNDPQTHLIARRPQGMFPSTHPTQSPYLINLDGFVRGYPQAFFFMGRRGGGGTRIFFFYDAGRWNAIERMQAQETCERVVRRMAYAGPKRMDSPTLYTEAKPPRSYPLATCYEELLEIACTPTKQHPYNSKAPQQHIKEATVEGRGHQCGDR